MELAPYSSVEELKRLAGCPLRGDIVDIGVKQAAERERMMLEWQAADRELKPEDATDSDDEDDEKENGSPTGPRPRTEAAVARPGPPATSAPRTVAARARGRAPGCPLLPIQIYCKLSYICVSFLTVRGPRH